MDKGYTQIYTGGGKGKSTAAFGLALRALGHGKRVRIIQFLKRDENYGEYKMFSKLAEISQHGTGNFVDPKNPSAEDVSAAEKGFEEAKKSLMSGMYDIVILDEIIVAVSLNLIKEIEVVNLIENKPERTELVLTGRGATGGMVEAADLVTEMREIKHYFKKGVNAREGVEY